MKPDQITKQSAYKEAGVDIDQAAALIERIKPHIKKTNRSGVMSGIGGFGALFDLKATGIEDPVIVSATDGVGTKIKIAIETDKHNTIGIDCVAMCVNDLVVQGAEPLFFLDYFATGKLVNDVAESVIASVAEGCEIAGCALIGGETAEMPGLYAPGDYDLAGFSVGAVSRSQMITGETITDGDVILGLASSGVHSNGFSLVRKLVKETDGFTYDSVSPFADGLTLGELLLMPTRIYVRSLLEAFKIKNAESKPAIKGMAHITGGGFVENIPRVLPQNTKAVINVTSWNLPPVFRWLKQIGNLSHSDMMTTLNCGIGMAVVCAPQHVDAITASLKNAGESVFMIGKIKKRGADEEPITLENLDQAWQD